MTEAAPTARQRTKPTTGKADPKADRPKVVPNTVKDQDKPDRVLHVQFARQHYVVQKSDVDDVEIFELLEDGKSITALRQMLGLEQWAKFKAAARDDKTGKVTLTVMNEFLNEIMTVIGGARGNS